MTLDEPARQSTGIRFSEAAIAARDGVFGQFRHFAKLVILPFFLTIALAVLEIAAMLTIVGSNILFLVLEFVPFAVLGVALNRAILMGPEPGLLPRAVLGMRTLKCLGYMLLISLIIITPFVILILTAVGASFVTGSEQDVVSISANAWTIAGGVLGVVLMIYLSARLGLVFPAVAVDHKLGLRGALRISRGTRGVKLSFIFLGVIIFLVLLGVLVSLFTGQQIYVGTGLPDDLVLAADFSVSDVILAALPTIFVSAVLSYIGFGLMIGAYAYAFTRLGGWGSAREEILERFE